MVEQAEEAMVPTVPRNVRTRKIVFRNMFGHIVVASLLPVLRRLSRSNGFLNLVQSSYSNVCNVNEGNVLVDNLLPRFTRSGCTVGHYWSLIPYFCW